MNKMLTDTTKAAILPDIQRQFDRRNIAINNVGVKGVRYPLVIASADGAKSTIGTFAMTVSLPPEAKGTHMSRFLEMLEENRALLTQESFLDLAKKTRRRLGASCCEIELAFPFFLEKTAPVSRAQGLLDFDVVWTANVSANDDAEFVLKTIVPATSLCPCSKEISKYGAHNQRSLISIEATLREKVTIEELVDIAQQSASCEVYSILKRPDEKHVTEHAYENPKFVEDMVRDVAIALDADSRIANYVIEVENFESIHNHPAYAKIIGSLETELLKAA